MKHYLALTALIFSCVNGQAYSSLVTEARETLANVVNTSPEAMFIGTFTGATTALATLSHINKPAIPTFTNVANEAPIALTVAAILAALTSISSIITPNIEYGEQDNVLAAGTISGIIALVIEICLANKDQKHERLGTIVMSTALAILTAMLAQSGIEYTRETIAEALAAAAVTA